MRGDRTVRPTRRATTRAAVIGFVLHTLTALWVWLTWGLFGRGIALSWLDAPASITYMHLDGPALLATSLLVGGLQWAAIAALFSLLVGFAVRRRAR